MDGNTAGISRVTLRPGESMLLDDATRVEVTCRRGCLWLTQYGDGRDTVLEPGRSFVASLPAALIMATGAGTADLTLRRCPASPVPETTGTWLRRLAGLFDPRWSSRVGRELAGRVRVHRAA